MMIMLQDSTSLLTIKSAGLNEAAWERYRNITRTQQVCGYMTR
jgi:hypothetical protein